MSTPKYAPPKARFSQKQACSLESATQKNRPEIENLKVVGSPAKIAVTVLAPVAPTKIKSKRRRKPARDQSLAQPSLFNASGLVPFNFQTDAKEVLGMPGVVDVAGMRLELLPPPNDHARATCMTLDALRLLHLARKQWKYIRPGWIKPIQLDSWECRSCTVTFRKQIDDGMIRATYSRFNDHLDLSIPHPTLWKERGLRWLISYSYCCARNIENPTPWLGPSCGCEKRLRRAALDLMRRKAAA